MQALHAPILVVDDSSTMRTIVSDMLTRLGFRNIDEAASGEAALAKVQARGYALIISDWHMESMSGLDLLRKVRQLRTPGSNRFVFVTSERTWSSQTTAKIDGAEAFITKPFTVETLKNKLESVLGR